MMYLQSLWGWFDMITVDVAISIEALSRCSPNLQNQMYVGGVGMAERGENAMSWTEEGGG